MNKRRGRVAHWMLLLGLALLTAGCSTPSSSPRAEGSPATSASTAAKPGYNVVLVSFDAMRAQETSFLGYSRDTTPNLARFAASAAVFENAVAPASWTLPATMAIFTGLHPSVHGVVNKLTLTTDNKMVDSQLSPTITTLPQLLYKAGYVLGAFTGDAGVSARFGFGRDFDAFLDDQKFGGFDHSLPAALKWLEAHKNQKFFLFLHGYDVHGQFDPPEGYRRTFAKEYKGRLHGDKEEQGRFREQALKNKFSRPDREPRLTPKEFTAEEGRFYQALYDEKIHRADARFGEFLKAMDQMGLTDKTIFVLLADHGEEFLEHGNLDHGPTLYQEMIHVPLIIKIPGMAPRKITQRVCSFDALPTVLDFLGIPCSHIDAISLLPAIEGKEMQFPPVFSETDYRMFSHKRTVIVDDKKLIHSLDTDKWEYYDLKADPTEQHPLPIGKAPAALALRKQLADWEDGLPRRYPDYGSDEGKTIKVY